MSPENLPTYISLNQAATRYNVNVAMLRRAVEAGIMRAVKINEEVIVADEDVAVVAAQVKAKDKGDELVSISGSLGLCMVGVPRREFFTTDYTDYTDF
ncbi:MAG: hypothetical protein U9R05_01735 [Chloroflexota bacterium]|nr:hypothetical protein [Chloroflexota bacterium]